MAQASDGRHADAAKGVKHSVYRKLEEPSGLAQDPRLVLVDSACVTTPVSKSFFKFTGFADFGSSVAG